MQEFESYIKSNYNVSNATACAINYTYNTRLSQDKKSQRMIINCIINMKVTWFDKDGKQLLIEKLAFQNDTITKASEKQCKVISPTEATNKFRIAKPHIVQQLIKAKQSKVDDLQHDINTLYSYLGSNSDIIPHQMKNTMQITDSTTNDTTHSKTLFDM